ncbi:MAG: hypothetical protein F4X11_00615 [Acidobacteria bacterium]|nr:hypothetical protein [Acidobacteriota bacterium]
MTSIEIRGARTHNLKGVHVNVPKHRLVAFTGVSGSGKSSLVFDIICTEAQRQLVETFSNYARRRLPQFTRPPVDAIRNISPCIVIDQKRLGRSSCGTIGTVTEIYTYLRMLFSRYGRPFTGWSHRFSFNHPAGMCPACKGLGKRITVDVDKLLDLDRSIEEGAIRHPAYDIGKWYWRKIVQTGVVPPRKPLRRFTAAERQRLLWADDVRIEKVHQGTTYERTFEGVARKLERLHVDKDEDRIPRAGREAYRRLFTERACPDCGGVRLNAAARAVELAGGWTVGRLVDCELTELDRVLEELLARDDYEPIRDVVATLVSRMRGTLRHLIDIGVGYLSLNRGCRRCPAARASGSRWPGSSTATSSISSTSWTSRPWGSIRGTSITSSPCSAACATTATPCSSLIKAERRDRIAAGWSPECGRDRDLAERKLCARCRRRVAQQAASAPGSSAHGQRGFVVGPFRPPALACAKILASALGSGLLEQGHGHRKDHPRSREPASTHSRVRAAWRGWRPRRRRQGAGLRVPSALCRLEECLPETG